MEKDTTFNNIEKLQEMLCLRNGTPTRNSLSINILADIFGCSVWTISLACSKHDVHPEFQVKYQKIKKQLVRKTIFGDRINPGKTYKEYLAIERLKKGKK